MNFLKKLKNVVNDIIPNEIKNNDFVKAGLLAAGAYYGYGYAPDSVKTLFKTGPGSLVTKGKGFLFGTPETSFTTTQGQRIITKATEGKFGKAGKLDLFETAKKGYSTFKDRQSGGEAKEQSKNLVPTITNVSVNPNISTRDNYSKYSVGQSRMTGMTDPRVELALAQLANSRNFIQAMNGNIPMDFVQPGGASGPTVQVGKATIS